MDDKYSNDLEKPFTPLNVVEEASRCLLCLDAPCSASCPAGTAPDRFIRSVRFRNFKGAAEIVRENNALGAICARVCPTEKYCQKACARCGIDRPIDIGKIQRYITDFEAATNMHILVPGKSNGLSVGIVGSGPAALQAACSLRRMGYAVTIYEKEKECGGMLNAIPTYRLSKKVIDIEINRIKQLGVTFRTNTKVGADISLTALKKKHDVVLIAVGYSYGKLLDLFKNNKKVVIAVDLLKKIKAHKGVAALPDNVLVVGGGDVAMDVVTTLKLLKVKHVTDVVYETLDEFKASKKELQNARDLKVSIYDGYIPTSIKNGVVNFTHRFIDSQLAVKADLIVLAVGQYPKVDGLSLKLVKNEVNEKAPYHTSDPKVFVAGDIAHSAYDKTVVGAVRTGKEVALAIDQKLRGKKHA